MNMIIGSGIGAGLPFFCLRKTEVLKVLGPKPQTIAFEPRQIAGCRLLMSLAEHVALDAAVRIDHDTAFLLGEVTGCWEAPLGTVLAVVELRHYYPLR